MIPSRIALNPLCVRLLISSLEKDQSLSQASVFGRYGATLTAMFIPWKKIWRFLSSQIRPCLIWKVARQPTMRRTKRAISMKETSFLFMFIFYNRPKFRNLLMQAPIENLYTNIFFICQNQLFLTDQLIDQPHHNLKIKPQTNMYNLNSNQTKPTKTYLPSLKQLTTKVNQTILFREIDNKIMLNKSFSPLNPFKRRNKAARSKLMTILITFVIVTLIARVESIVPSQPIMVSPNTQSSPSNFIFNFILEKQLESTGYLLINFSPLTTTTTPKSCIVVDGNSSLAISKCLNLDAGSTAGTLSINTTWINQINPNIAIAATKTIAVQFNQALAAGVSYSIQILTNNVLPAIGSITSNFEMYTISGTGFMLEENWNFGQVYFEYRQNNILNVNSINDLTQNYPGTLTSNLEFEITIGVQCPTPYSVVKFIISDDFEFSASSLVNVQGVLSTAPQVISTTIVSPNIIITKFGESFVSGRKFKVSITDIKNPLKISSGYVSVYYLPDNSMSPLEIKELAIPIGTKKYVPTVEILTGQGITATSPIQFYQSKQQYMTVTIVLPRQLDSTFIIQILTDTLTIQEGTVYAKSSTSLASKLIYSHYTAFGVRILGFPSTAAGSKITVTMKVWIPITPSFNVAVSIDTLSSIAIPIMQGSAPTTDTVVATDFVSLLTGNEGQTYKLSSMTSAIASPYSFISFVVTPTFPTEVGSSLKIYTCENLIKAPTFNSAVSCLVAGVSKTCSLATNDTTTLITINSGSSNNLFPISVATSVVINDLQFKYVSSNTEFIYQFYFQITLSQSATNPVIKKTLLTPQVIPERPSGATDTGFRNYFSNDLANTTSNYPEIFRIVSTVPAKWNYIVQATQRRMITIFHKEKWTKLFTTLTSGDAYPFLSSMSGVTSTFIKGTTTHLADQYPLTWDQLHFILPGAENTTTFSIAIPTNYTVDADFHFEIMSGIYNVETRTITYRGIEQLPVSGSRTYLLPASVAISAKPKQTSTKLQLAGRAGSYKNKIELTVVPAPSNTFTGTKFSTALIILSAWNWFDQTTIFNPTNVSSATVGYPLFTNDHQKPLSLKIANEQYLTYIPFTKAAGAPLSFSVFFDNVKLPYTHDLPYYSILLIDETGTIDSYNEFINQDQGVFYQTTLKKISFACSDSSLGVTNTDCSIGFIPNQQIEIGSKIYVTLTGLTVSTNKCILTKNSDSSTTLNDCQSNTDKNELVVTLKNTQRLIDSTEYTLKIYGMSITDSTINHYADMSIRDSSGGYVIESGTRILMTSVSSYFPIYIEQMTYLKNNPIVVSGFNIIFTLPRQLNKDEVFAIVMGNDLSNLNSVPSKLKIRLYHHSNNTQIPNVRWFLNTKNYQIIFQGLHSHLDATKYRLQIYGMKTPSTIDQNIIALIYLRTFDNTYTVQNTPQSTAAYPSLVDKVNSLITLRPYFNTEGLEQPLEFNITGQYAKVDANTVWYITLPRYYSQMIWNQEFLVYCTINFTRLDCDRHENIPYTIVVRNSPKVIDANEWYTLSVYGITCPRSTYLNVNPTYVTESIFFGIALNESSQSYIEYSELFMTETIKNPQVPTGYGTITAKQVTSSNSETFQTTYFTVKLSCSVAISAGDYMFITFPEGFNNFNDLDMEGELKVGAVTKTFTASAVNTKIGFEIPAGVSISANNDFTIEMSSLPTPKSTISIDMNKMIFILTPSSKTTTKASSLQLHNQVNDRAFTTTELHLVINNYQPIQLTAGTSTTSVKIESSDHTSFQSNIKVQFISSSLTFSPNPLSLYIGDTAGYFTISAPQTLIPTTYTFQIIKSESSISAFYTALSRYSVRVINTPIPITIPTGISLPRGACSIPVTIALTKATFSDLQVHFEYDTDVYKLDDFWINEEISYTELEFTKSIVERQLSFCCASNFTASSIPITVYLGGTNEQAYTLSTTNFTVTIVSNASTTSLPTLAIAVVNTQKTYAKLSATTNLAGILYYELKLSPLANPLALIDLKYEIKQKNLTLQSQSDFMSKIYIADRDHRINFASMATGTNFIEFENLLPERQYTFCAYFQNQHRNTTDRICQTFTMQNWGSIKKVYIKFKNTIQENQLNNILCYFVKTSGSEISQIVSLEGKSCSLNTSASNYYFAYPGQVKANELSSTIIYHVSNQNLTTDPSSSAFSSMYDASGITTTSLATALANFSINYINNSNSLGSFNPIDAITTSSSPFQPTLFFSTQAYQRGTTSLFLRNLQLSTPGSIYLILTPYKKLTRNQIAGHTDIEIRPLITPTHQQLLNCKDGYGVDALSCQRIVLKDGEKMDVELTGIQQNRMYAVFYVLACEYPLRPVVYGSVQKVEMKTVVAYGVRGGVGLVGVLLLGLIVLMG